MTPVEPEVLYRQHHGDDAVYRDPRGYWVLSRHRDVRDALQNVRDFSSTLSGPAPGGARRRTRDRLAYLVPRRIVARFHSPGPKTDAEQLLGVQTRWLTDLDPPEHTHLRARVSQALTPARLTSLRPSVEALTVDLLENLGQLEAYDLVGRFTIPLTILTVAQILGIPSQDYDLLRAGLLHWPSLVERHQSAKPGAIAETRPAIVLLDYVRELVRERSGRPGHDLISALLAPAESHPSMTNDGVVATALLVAVAGHITTKDLIGSAMFSLLHRPEQLESLSNTSGSMGTAVNELLRFASPAQFAARRATRDVTVGDTVIRENDVVRLALAAANRDPEAFSEPDRLDLARRHNPHLAFGHGIHVCAGAGLARLVAEIALRALVQRFPRLHVHRHDVAWRNDLFRGPRELWVTGG